MSRRRILYVQYTNPANYPPLEHSSRLLAARGWDVLFLGTGDDNPVALALPPHPRIAVRTMRRQRPGVAQKLHFARFCAWVALAARRWQPAWLYASDPLAAPAALLARRLAGARLLYHEHDTPSAPGALHPAVRQARARAVATGDLCVVPNRERAAVLQAQTGVRRDILVVWNCPALEDLAAGAGGGDAERPVEGEPAPRGPARSGPDPFRILYQGSVVPRRLPLTVLEALARLPRAVELWIVGYDPGGRYLDRLQAEAGRLGLASRVRIRGAMDRHRVLAVARDCHLGLSLVPRRTDDVNLRHLVGASNKAFEYLACGVAILVSDLPEWRATFVEPGYGLACDPDDPASLAEALGRAWRDPEATRRMGERGRARIRVDWNYEAQFTPVYDRLAGAVAGPGPPDGPRPG